MSRCINHSATGARQSIKVRRSLALIVVSLALVAGATPSFSAGPPTAPSHQAAAKRPGRFNVKDFAAKGDGVADDTPAVQAAISAAARSAGGGTVLFPKGTYLLNSSYPSRHPWAFHNLVIDSDVTLVGETGAKLLQGPRGRHPRPEGAEGVRNTVLAFGADHETIRFQNPTFNGGFYSLQATRASSTTVALKTASESSKFRPGDYVAIYETTSVDVIPTETGRITTVNASSGELGLKEPLSRSFQTPSIANVTKIATTNVGVKNLIVEGSEPLTVTETFGFTAQGCRFINDTSIGDGNVIDYNLNTLNGFRFHRNLFTSVGPGYSVMEMTQRNSRHGVWDGNTFEIVQGGMGEYAANIQFTNNTFRLHPNDRTSVGLMIGGKNIDFRKNSVTCGNIPAGEGWGCLLADCVGPGYERYVGNITIADNVFNYEGAGNQCVHLVARDTSFTGNTLNVKGSALGVRAEGPPPQTLTLKNNTLRMGTGAGIMIASSRVDGSTVTGNKISGSGAYGIYVASPKQPNDGKHVIYGNTVTGYRKELFIDLALHPGAVFALLAPAPQKQVTVLTTFPGASGPGPKDCPDNTGAVGPHHAMDFTNANVVIHTKETGKVVEERTQTEFWKTVKPGFDLAGVNDPRLLYDPLSGRWFGTVAGPGRAAVGYLAVSETSDPTKGWLGIKLPMQPTDPGIKLGVDKNGLYIAYYVLTGDIHSMMTVYAIPKEDAIAPEGPSLAHLQTLANLEIECFPATDLDPNKAPDAPEILLNREFGDSFSKLHLYRITWAGKNARISSLQTIPLSTTYVSPNGASRKNQGTQPAPGGKLRADEGRRTQCVFAHAGSLFACNEAKRTLDSRPGIFWCEVRASDGALQQEGFIDSPECDYLAPSLAVDATGNVGIGCTRTSEKEFASAVVMMRAVDDPKNTMRAPVLAAKGTSTFTSNGQGAFGIAWGNYNATCLDPLDPSTLWTTQEYSASGVRDRWTTCWVAFTLK